MTPPLVDRAVRDDVAEVLVRYASGIDRRDWSLFRTCFSDDCQADYGEIGVWHSGDEITAWMQQSHAMCGHSLHRITNVTVSPNGDGVIARSYVDAIVMGPSNRTASESLGYYDDQLVPTEDGWKIARRHFTMVHLRLDVGPSAVLDMVAPAEELG